MCKFLASDANGDLKVIVVTSPVGDTLTEGTAAGVAFADTDGCVLPLDNDGDVEHAVNAKVASASRAVVVAMRRSIPEY